MSATSARLLQVACEVVGGSRALARRLGIEQAMLARYMADQRELPDPLLLRALDIVLVDREVPPLCVLLDSTKDVLG